MVMHSRLKFNQQKLQRRKQNWSANGSTYTFFSKQCQAYTAPASSSVISQGSVGLHAVPTYQIEMNVRKCALQLAGIDLLAKLAPGDMIFLEAKYHCNCLCDLYIKHVKLQPGEDANMHGISFTE